MFIIRASVRACDTLCVVKNTSNSTGVCCNGVKMCKSEEQHCSRTFFENCQYFELMMMLINHEILTVGPLLCTA